MSIEDAMRFAAGIGFDRPAEPGPDGKPVRCRIEHLATRPGKVSESLIEIWYSDADAARLCSQLLSAMRATRMDEFTPPEDESAHHKFLLRPPGAGDANTTPVQPPMISGEPTPPIG